MKSIEYIEEVLKTSKVRVVGIIEEDKTRTENGFKIIKDYQIITRFKRHSMIYHLVRFEDNSYILGCFGLVIPLTSYQARYILDMSKRNLENNKTNETT